MDGFARRQDVGALLVAGIDEMEEPIRLLAVQRPETDLSFDQQWAVHI